MSIVTTINTAYNEAAKAKNIARRDTLKLVKSAFQTLDKATPNKETTEAEYMNTLAKMVKTRKETAQLYPRMAEQELAEANIIEEFIPQQLSEIEVTALIVNTAMALNLEIIKKNMGQLVKAVVANSLGKTDGKTVSTLINTML